MADLGRGAGEACFKLVETLLGEFGREPVQATVFALMLAEASIRWDDGEVSVKDSIERMYLQWNNYPEVLKHFEDVHQSSGSDEALKDDLAAMIKLDRSSLT